MTTIPAGIYSVIGDQPGRRSVRLMGDSRQLEIAYEEFQRLKTVGMVERL